jgi:hypothetical protein
MSKLANYISLYFGQMGSFPFEKNNHFAFPECPMAKWNATA